MRQPVCAGVAIAFALFFFAAAVAEGEELPAEYLWCELGASRLLANGAMEQTIRIGYGAFPALRLDLAPLQDLALWSAANPQDEVEKRVWLPLAYRLTPQAAEAAVCTPTGNRVALLAQARAGKTLFTARFSFVLFGAGAPQPLAEKALPSTRKLLLLSLPEFDSWPQTQQPQELFVSWQGHPSLGIVYACDENVGCERLPVDGRGKTRHIPPRDYRLDQQGETAFKHVVYVSAVAVGDTKEVATYTRILHRARFANRQHAAGIMLFLGCFTSICDARGLSSLRR